MDVKFLIKRGVYEKIFHWARFGWREFCVFWEGRFDGLGNMCLVDVMVLNSVCVSVRVLKNIASFTPL